MRKLFISVSVSLLVLIIACSPKSAPTTSTPPPEAKTTYTGAVQSLIQSKCSPCHIPANGGRKADFSNYAAAMKFASDMVVRIDKAPTDRGFMPFKNPKLSPEDIAVFKKWVSDGTMEK